MDPCGYNRWARRALVHDDLVSDVPAFCWCKNNRQSVETTLQILHFDLSLASEMQYDTFW